MFGWGWVSFWPPWVEPFSDLIERGGIIQLHAHEAWLDVWLQLGIVGLVVFGFLVLTTAVRAWLLAIDPVRYQSFCDGPAPISMLWLCTPTVAVACHPF